MQHAEGEPAGEHRGRRVRAERDLLDLVDLHVRAAAGEQRAQRDRARAADRIDADALADHVLAAGLRRIDRGEHPVGVGPAVDRDQVGARVGDLVDHRQFANSEKIETCRAYSSQQNISVEIRG